MHAHAPLSPSKPSHSVTNTFHQCERPLTGQPEDALRERQQPRVEQQAEAVSVMLGHQHTQRGQDEAARREGPQRQLLLHIQ